MNDIVSQLVSQSLLTSESAERVRVLTAAGKPLEDALRSVDSLSEEKLLRFWATEFNVPFVELEKYTTEHPPSPELLSRCPVRVLLDRKLLPLRMESDQTMVVASSRLFDTTGQDELRLATGLEVHPMLAVEAEIDRCIKRYLGIGADTLQSMGENSDIAVVEENRDDDDLDLTHAAQDASIIKFVNQVMSEALERRATDVHVEPFEDLLRVRYRIDGVLQEANIPAQVRRFQAAIVSRLKILSHLDIAEKRLPQDGRIRLKVGGREIDLRVSVIPMLHGEAVVLRILDRGDALLGLEHLGMGQRDRTAFERVLDLPHGIVLVTGPTGSGKTTTLYAGLSKINDIERKIITIEDPVEYQLRGINQIQVNAKSGLDFARGLRAILRHDPDVVLIGEIRDRETADIAVQASLTGHLVFSTLHTNDAPGATTRLIDMGIEPYLVASSLELVLAQRLVRLICKECREPVPERDLDMMRAEYGAQLPEVVWHGRGCRVCQGSGFRGRQGVFEMMPVTEEIRGQVLERASSGEIRKLAVEQGMSSLRDDGWRLIAEGRTTLEEVIRVTKDETMGVTSAIRNVTLAK